MSRLHPASAAPKAPFLLGLLLASSSYSSLPAVASRIVVGVIYGSAIPLDDRSISTLSIFASRNPSRSGRGHPSPRGRGGMGVGALCRRLAKNAHVRFEVLGGISLSTFGQLYFLD